MSADYVIQESQETKIKADLKGSYSLKQRRLGANSPEAFRRGTPPEHRMTKCRPGAEPIQDVSGRLAKKPWEDSYFHSADLDVVKESLYRRIIWRKTILCIRPLQKRLNPSCQESLLRVQYRCDVRFRGGCEIVGQGIKKIQPGMDPAAAVLRTTDVRPAISNH